MNTYNPLQLREIFHLEFLRRLGRKIKAQNYSLKGGANLRFFFSSFRYSEDMDLDLSGIKTGILKEVVMNILTAESFQDNLRPFGIERIVPPDISKAKQTETTQRFKVHLITENKEDLFTKIEFSRRSFGSGIIIQAVSEVILRAYKLPPLLAAHYTAEAAIAQKISALAGRSVTQARDIFDLYLLTSQFADVLQKIKTQNNPKISTLTKANDNIFEINFEQFRDTVLSYLTTEDSTVYNTPPAWDEIKLKVSNFIEKLKEKYA